MAKFRIYATITGSRYLGMVEADTAEAALQAAEDEHLESPIGICHQCAREIEEPTITGIIVEDDE